MPFEKRDSRNYCFRDTRAVNVSLSLSLSLFLFCTRRNAENSNTAAFLLSFLYSVISRVLSETPFPANTFNAWAPIKSRGRLGNHRVTRDESFEWRLFARGSLTLLRRNSSAPGDIKILRVEYFRDTGAAGFLRERFLSYARSSYS